MNTTIREYLKRRVWWCAGAGLIGWLMFPLGAALEKSLPPGIPPAALPLAGAVVFAGAILALQRIVRCPKCKARLGQTIAMPLAFSWGSGPKVNFCPFCGVNFDEPMTPGEPAPRSKNPIHPE